MLFIVILIYTKTLLFVKKHCLSSTFPFCPQCPRFRLSYVPSRKRRHVDDGDGGDDGDDGDGRGRWDDEDGPHCPHCPRCPRFRLG